MEELGTVSFLIMVGIGMEIAHRIFRSFRQDAPAPSGASVQDGGKADLPWFLMNNKSAVDADSGNSGSQAIPATEQSQRVPAVDFSGADELTYRWEPSATSGRDAFLGMFDRGKPASWGHDFTTDEIKIRYPDMIFILDGNGRLLHWECLEEFPQL